MNINTQNFIDGIKAKNRIVLQLLGTACLIAVMSLQVSAQDKFVPYTQEIGGVDIGIEMVPIKGGSFMMGSSSNDPLHSKDEAPVHKVEISPFWMGKFEITWNQYELYMNSRDMESQSERKGKVKADAISQPSKTYIDPSFGMGKDGYPAISMTHFAALSFTRWLTLKTGHFYRLPTEAEWEYACRAGTSTAYHFGNKQAKLNDYAWFRGNSQARYHQVGTKKPNSWGLYDMHGNIAEWTLDQYHSDFYAQFAGETAQDPWAKPKELYPRTVRGGSWNHEAEQLRCASRIPSDPRRWKRGDPQIPKSLWWNTNAPFVGFRLVRPLNPPSKEEIEQFWKETLDQFYYE